MKTKHLFVLAPLFALIITLGYLSSAFTREASSEFLEGDKPVVKKIEIIRSNQGELHFFDTIVPIESSYTEEDFLEDLGFENDKNLSVIKVSDHLLNMKLDFSDFESVIKAENGKENMDVDGLHLEIDLTDIEKEVKELEDEFRDVRIESHFFIDSSGKKEWSAKELELSQFLDEMEGELINSFNMDTTFFENGTTMRVFCSSENLLHHADTSTVHATNFFQLDSTDVNIDFDFDFDIGDEHTSFFFDPSNACTKMDLVYSGEHEQGDFTMVIVREGTMDDFRTTSDLDENEESHFTIYPNPASDYVQVKMDFTQKEETILTVFDGTGKLVMEKDYGKFEGQFTEQVALGKLSSGTYIIQLRHGNERFIEQLLIK